MNILPQKSWHVRTRKNIERVRRDEAKAAEEEKEKQRRIALAEQEARTDLLRKRAKLRDDNQIEGPVEKIQKISDTDEEALVEYDKESGRAVSSPSTSTDIFTSSGHINFFKEIEAGEVKQGKNKDHEDEKRAEKEKWEKDIGLLTYLGQSSVESREKPPWYLAGRKKDKDHSDPIHKDQKLKESLDPLNQMKSYLHKPKHEEKERHYKHKSKKKKKERDSPKPVKHSSATKTMEQLRAERLNRERQERQRALDLLYGGQTQKSTVSEEPIDERKRGYNSVFNPDLVRKPKQRQSFLEKY